MRDVARYRRLYVNDWHDPRFRGLNNGCRIVNIYVEAGPQTTPCGCFRLSTAVAVEDLGGTAEAFEQDLATVCDVFGHAWDPLARVIWLTNWFERNPPANPNVVQSWAKLLRNVPDCDVRTQAISSINRALKELPASFRAPWLALSKGFPVGESKAESRTETPQRTENSNQRSGKQRAGALARVGFERTKPRNTVNPGQLIKLVRDVVKQAPNQSVEYHEQAFRTFHSDNKATRDDVLATIHVVLDELRSQVSA